MEPNTKRFCAVLALLGMLIPTASTFTGTGCSKPSLGSVAPAGSSVPAAAPAKRPAARSAFAVSAFVSAPVAPIATAAPAGQEDGTVLPEDAVYQLPVSDTSTSKPATKEFYASKLLGRVKQDGEVYLKYEYVFAHSDGKFTKEQRLVKKGGSGDMSHGNTAKISRSQVSGAESVSASPNVTMLPDESEGLPGTTTTTVAMPDGTKITIETPAAGSSPASDLRPLVSLAAQRVRGPGRAAALLSPAAPSSTRTLRPVPLRPAAPAGTSAVGEKALS